MATLYVPMKLLRAGLVTALLGACPALLPAQNSPIIVVANRNFRPTAVLLPHLRYVIATDSNDLRAVIRDVAVPPVAFAGEIRIEGIQPGARSFESRPFADTVRFETDGRVVMRLADHAERPPMTVEIFGSRTAAGGRIVITAPQLPAGRALLVSIAPADIYDLLSRNTGFGIRDRLRVDDRAGIAYLRDTTAGPATVAIGMGSGTSGRIQFEAEFMVDRVIPGEDARQRRAVGALIMALEPTRDAAGIARAEVVFGLGNSELEAAQSARTAAGEAPANPPGSPLRVNTPLPEVNTLTRHLLTVGGLMMYWEALGVDRSIPASAAQPAVRAHEAWLGTALAQQRADTAAICGSYRIMRRAAGDGPARVEYGPRLGPRGRYLATSDSTDPTADASLVLLAWACYSATRSSAFLRNEFGVLSAAAGRAAREGGTLAADALERLAELDDELVRDAGSAPTGGGDSLRAEAERVSPSVAPPPAATIWRVITTEALRGVNRDYGRIATSGEMGGLAMAAAGTFLDLLTGELFGVTPSLGRVEVSPNIDGIADDFTWQLDGLLLGGGDTLNLRYRPADRRAEVRVTASRRIRVALRFPWMTAESCVLARRGRDTERLATVALSDGAYYVDVRGAFEPAQLTIAAGACSS